MEEPSTLGGAIALQDQAEAAAGIVRKNRNSSSQAMTEVQLRAILDKLRDSKSPEAAYESMVVLDQLLDTNHVTMQIRKQTAQRITRMYGVTTILVSLAHYYHGKNSNSDFTGVAIHFLVNMTYLSPPTIPLIVYSGLRTILAAANDYPLDYVVSSNTVGLLHNCSEYDADVRLQVSTEECLDMVVNAMSKWSGSSYHQERGSVYLYEMSRMHETKVKLLREKRVCSLLANTLDQFRNQENPAFRAAQRTLKVYYGH